MRNTILLLATMFVAAGCGMFDLDSTNERFLTVDNDLKTIRLRGNNETYEFGFKVVGEWHIEIEGDGFTIDPMSGEAGVITATLTAPLSDAVELGSFTIVVDKADVRYTVEVFRSQAMPVAEKTVIAYFFGTSLMTDFASNINTMKKAVGNDILGNNRLMIYHQLSKTEAEVAEIYYDSDSKRSSTVTVERPAITESLSAESFAANLRSIMDYAPAENYSVIFLGHATAWLPQNPIVSTLSAHHFRKPSMEKMAGAAVTRFVGEIGSTTDSSIPSVMLDIDELTTALSSTGEKFEFLYFDACFMSSLETVYELRNTADWIIGSPCEIMGYGSPYDTILAPLFDGDYEAVCHNYFEFYNNYFYKSGCISAVDCSKLDAVASAMKRINAADADENFDINNVQPYDGRTDHWFFDAEDYCYNICADKALADEFAASLEACIPWREHTDGFYSAYNGRMNDITYYSGISLTPDETCMRLIEETMAKMKADIEELREQLKSSSDSELQSRLRALESSLEKLDEQNELFGYYNPSLRRTSWHKATHI